MATSDGISTEDWDVVHQFAVDIVNAADGQEAEYRRLLLDWLERLESKYGPLPSILATRADYVDADDPVRERLLLNAHTAGDSIGDTTNLLVIAHSLVEMYLERKHAREADRWLNRMKEHLRATPNTDYAGEYERLRAEYRRLAITRAGLPKS